jgi:hypothetical protein
MERLLNRSNIVAAIEEYESSIAEIGDTLAGLRGIPLFQCLKRNQIGLGPYPHVTPFEAANRIMTDLVILKGVRWLLDSRTFPFDEYLVEYGNENCNDHDVFARNGDKLLIGEAFNVAPSFFQGKKTAMRKKLLASKSNSDYMIILANEDAVEENYSPKMLENEYYVFVNVESGIGRVLSNNLVSKSADAPVI